MSSGEVWTWYRVFARSDAVPSIHALRETLTPSFSRLEGAYQDDEAGWTERTFQVPQSGMRWTLSRYSLEDDDIRGELQAWAAWLETCTDHPQHQMLMQHIIATKQVFTFQQAEGLPAEACAALCRFLAGATEGVYQVDGQGFFTSTGEVLLEEPV